MRREYLENSDMYENPYKYWIACNEPPEYARSGYFKDEQEAMEELEDVYDFFELKEGVRANGFATRVKDALAGIKYDTVYFDEDIIDTASSGGMAEALRRFTGRGVLNSRRKKPFFKPDFSPDTLRSFYYPGALTLVSRKLAERIAAGCGFEYGSAEFLRECLLSAKEVLHIPQVLFHTYEEGDTEYADAPEEVGEHIDKTEYKESITCIILSRDNPGQLKTCIEGLRRSEREEGVRLNIAVVDNGSQEENRSKAEDLAAALNFEYLYEKREFIYSGLNNLGAQKMKEIHPGDKYLLFLNDDIEIPEKTRFLRKMADTAGREHVGAVGVKLLYPDGKTIQHAGITLLRSGASHKLNGYPDEEEYYHGVNNRDINTLAVTGACLMVRRDVFEEIGGFDSALAVGYTDTELCVKLLTHGYYNVCLNSLYLIHHEGASRGKDLKSDEGLKRLIKERTWFYDHFGDFLKDGDPFYSPNLTDTGLDYSVRLSLPGSDVRLSCPEEYGGEWSLKREQEGGKLRFSLDSCNYELNDEFGNGDFYDIRGWAFIDGSGGYEYEKWLLLDINGKQYKVRAEDTYRKDVAEVFNKKGLCFAGFEAKITREALKDAGETCVALALIKSNTDKGYFAEDICRIQTVQA